MLRWMLWRRHEFIYAEFSRGGARQFAQQRPFGSAEFFQHRLHGRFVQPCGRCLTGRHQRRYGKGPLQRNLPPPSTSLTLVHGDYRTGNFLYTSEGDITTVLDWEMAHIGDPLEDLAWSLDPLWSVDPHVAGRLLPREDAIGIWQDASGMSVDRTAFKWWQIFASVKAIAIWISSAEDYVNGTTKEPILALAGWPLIDRQNRISSAFQSGFCVFWISVRIRNAISGIRKFYAAKIHD